MRKPFRFDTQYNEYVKDFYRKIEDYDWNSVVRDHTGLEYYLHRYRENAIRRLIKKYGQGSEYLDVGCGTGLILQHLPSNSIGIDLNPRHLERAKINAPSAQVHIGDAEELQFSDRSFSTVICCETIEHLVFPEKALQEIHRVLKDGGIFIGSTPRKALLWKLRFLSSTHFHNEPFHNEFTENELRALLGNFKVLMLFKRFFWASFFFVCRK